MFRHLVIILLGFLLIGLTGCAVFVPEIRGIVLDEETRQPVEDAWIAGTISLKTMTIGGDVGHTISLEPPHMRTDKYGRFVIPATTVRARSDFGSKAGDLVFSARTIDKRGSIEVGKEELKKDAIEITILVADEDTMLRSEYPRRTHDELEEIYSYSLGGIYNYCSRGRFGIERPAVKEGCDEWELNYAITKHERYLEKYKELLTIDSPPLRDPKRDLIRHYNAVMKQLGELYWKKGDYKMALEVYVKVKDYMQKHGLTYAWDLINRNIAELQKLIQEQQGEAIKQ